MASFASLPCLCGEIEPDAFCEYFTDAAVVSSVYKTIPSPEHDTMPRSPDCGKNFALKILARCAVLYCTKIFPLNGFVTTENLWTFNYFPIHRLCIILSILGIPIFWSSEPESRYCPLSFHDNVFTHPLCTLSLLYRLRLCT